MTLPKILVYQIQMTLDTFKSFIVPFRPSARMTLGLP